MARDDFLVTRPIIIRMVEPRKNCKRVSKKGSWFMDLFLIIMLDRALKLVAIRIKPSPLSFKVDPSLFLPRLVIITPRVPTTRAMIVFLLILSFGISR